MKVVNKVLEKLPKHWQLIALGILLCALTTVLLYFGYVFYTPVVVLVLWMIYVLLKSTSRKPKLRTLVTVLAILLAIAFLILCALLNLMRQDSKTHLISPLENYQSP